MSGIEMRRSRQLASAATFFAVMTIGLTAQAAETLKFLIPWTPSQESNKLTADFVIKTIKEVSGGELEAKLFGPNVVPAFQQLQPISSGVFDLHYTSPAYHGGATGIGQLPDTVTRDQKKRRESGLWAAIDEHYSTKHNAKILAVAGSTSYQFVLEKPIGPDGGLKGRKIRGNPAYESLINYLGGISVQLPPPQMYTALQKNLIDGIAFPVHSIVSLKIHEVAKYLVRPTFAASTNLLMINMTKWKKLTPKQQAALLELGKRFEHAAYDIPLKIAERDEKTILASGGKIVTLGDTYAKNIDKIYNEGIWARISKQQPADADPIIKIIKDKGIAYNGE
jgi:TRAP-type C4-dicarboxylate transport system substrate-binding protein